MDNKEELNEEDGKERIHDAKGGMCSSFFNRAKNTSVDRPNEQYSARDIFRDGNEMRNSVIVVLLVVGVIVVASVILAR